MKLANLLPAAAVLALSGISWLAVVFAQVPMPGELDLASFVIYFVAWAVGMAAMMLPSSIPIVSLLAQGDKSISEGTAGGRKASDPALFLAGYLGAWSALGVLAFSGSVATTSLLPLAVGARDFAGLVSGALIFLAGAYQLTPLKQRALQKCRSPTTFILTSWRTGTIGRVVMGVDYSVFCITCCWALIAILVLVGAMSLVWMAFLAGAILVERVVPHGEGFSKVFGALLMVLGLAIVGFGLL